MILKYVSILKKLGLKKKLRDNVEELLKIYIMRVNKFDKTWFFLENILHFYDINGRNNQFFSISSKKFCNMVSISYHLTE